MPKSFMHHVTIKRTEFELRDKEARTSLNDLKTKIDDFGFLSVKNLVSEMFAKTTNGVIAGSRINLTDSDTRACCVIPVEGDKYYSINTGPSNNFSGFAYSSDGNDYWIGAINSYKVDNKNYVFKAPENATKLYLCNTGWTINLGIVVLEKETTIDAASGYTKANYPFNKAVGIEAKLDIEPYASKMHTDEKLLIGNNVLIGNSLPAFSGNSSASDPLVISVSRIYYKSQATSGDFYVSSDSLANLTFSVPERKLLVFDYDTKTAYLTSDFSVSTNPQANKVVLLWKQGVTIKGEWAWMYYSQNINSHFSQLDRCSVLIGDNVDTGSSLPVFSGNTSGSDPLHIEISRMYYRNIGVSGMYVLTSDALANLSFDIPQQTALVFDYETKTANVVSITNIQTVNPAYKNVLLWKQGTTVKGSWAWMYYLQIMNSHLAVYDRCITERIHSRQGVGFGYPDNSLQGIKEAIKDGYPGIRISVASTRDGEIYCTHSYELRNNKTLDLNCVTIASTGEVYDGDVIINNVDSNFIDTLYYKGYAIPTLHDALSYLSRFSVDITLEVKDRMTTTAVNNMLDICNYYGADPVFSCDSYNISDLLAVSSELNIETILDPYSDELAETRYNSLKDSCKSLRFCIVYGGTTPSYSAVSDYHKKNIRYRIAGSSPTQAQFEDAIKWSDIVEVTGDYQLWTKRLIDETW